MAVIVVTDGGQRSALAVTRSLGRLGHEVHVVADRPHTIASASRFCRRSHVTPPVLTRPAAFADRVLELLREVEADVLLPVTDASISALAPRRDAIVSMTRFPLAPTRAYECVSNKALIAEEARRAGIAVPAQTVVDRAEDAEVFGAREWDYPVVLKPSRSVAPSANGLGRHGVAHVANATQLRERIGRFPPEAFPILVQQRIVGPGVGVFLLRWGGRTLAVFSHRRLREKPPAGGVSVYCESIPADPELVRKSEALLEAHAWQGVAMVEYKIDETTGSPFMMEVNGRFWGSLQLAIDAGVDFPALLVDAALGAPRSGPEGYRVGLRNRWLWGDFDHLLLRITRSRQALDLPDDAPGRLATVAAMLPPWRPGDRWQVLRPTDPLPFARETVDWIREVVG